MVRIRTGAGGGPAYRRFESRTDTPIYPTWMEGGARSLAVRLVYGPPNMVECMLVTLMSGGFSYIK